MKPLEIKIDNLEPVDLKEEYYKALEDPVIKKLVSRLRMRDEELFEYTSMLEASAKEYHNCLDCKGIIDCSNRIKGHVYIPNNVQHEIQFQYKSCKYYDKYKKNTNYLKKIKYFNVPTNLQEATISKIHKTDKNRFEAILWINNFYKDFIAGTKKKGLYLHGNFGCGKSYLIAALFNDLARSGYESSIIFWPEFVRTAFNDGFKNNYEIAKNVPLLLIDDIGAENLTAYNRDELLCPLLQHRMDEGLTTFFTSNLNLEQLEEHLSISKSGVEGVKAARIVARIKQLSEPLELVSKNLRK